MILGQGNTLITENITFEFKEVYLFISFKNLIEKKVIKGVVLQYFEIN